jgi:hypothetical protein
MDVKTIVASYLEYHGFDGLCHPDTECGCDLSDLIGPCEGAQSDCRPSYRIPLQDGGTFFTADFDHRPTEEEIRNTWEKIKKREGR